MDIVNRGPAGLDAIFQRRVKTCETKLVFGRIVGEGRDREYVIAWKLVDQMSYAGNIIGSRTARHPCHRVDDIRRRACRGDDRKLAWEGDIASRIAPAQGDRRGYQGTEFLDYGRGYAHQFCFMIDHRAVVRESIPRFFIANQEADLLKDFERGLVYVAYIVASQVGKEVHRSCIRELVIRVGTLGSPVACVKQ